MSPDQKKALAAGGIETLKLIPGIAILIESVRKYRQSIEEQQEKEFVQKLLERLKYIEQNLVCYRTEEGERFSKKLIANLFVNGPILEENDAQRLKYIEMVRLLSRPALQVLLKAVQLLPEHQGISVRGLATEIGWEPALVDACILELHAVGALPQKWFGDADNPERRTGNNTPVITGFTKSFAKVISFPAS